MRGLQMYYTSCKKGTTGSAGFQTWAITSGVRPEEQRELERRGAYKTPRGVNDRPTFEEIQESFPHAFRFVTLETGRWALIRSGYVGQDYSTRWGNFFAHSVVVETGRLPKWPIDYYEWSGWKEIMEAREDNGEAPAPLPSVDLDAIPAAESFQFDVLQEFLQGKPDRQGALANMLRALFLGKQNSRSLVIRDSFLNGLFWVACVQKSFPASLAGNLSFSTYQTGAQDCAVINATVDGTDFLFNDTERKFQFYMFDFVQGQDSEVSGAPDDYAAVMARWMREDPAKVSGFHDFMNAFSFTGLSEDLVWPLRLFQGKVGEDSGLDSKGLLQVIAFVNQYVRPEAREGVLVAFEGILRAAHNLALADYEPVFAFFLNAACSTGNISYRKRTLALWLHMFDAVVETQPVFLRKARELRGLLRTQLPDSEKDLAAQILEPGQMKFLLKHIDAVPSDVGQAVLFEVMSALRATGRVPIWKQPESEAILSALVLRKELPLLTAIFSLLINLPEAVAETCDIALEDAAKSGRASACNEAAAMLGEALRSALCGKESSAAGKIRAQLDCKDRMAILYAEFKTLIRTTAEAQRRQAYQDYVSAALPNVPNFAKAYRTDLANFLLDNLPAPLRSEQTFDWLQDGTLSACPESAAKWLPLAARSFSLADDRPSAVKRAEVIAAAARKHGFSLSPDVPFLRTLLANIEKKRRFSDDLLQKIPEALRQIDAENYRVFVERFWPAALQQIENREDYTRFIESIALPQYPEMLKGALIPAAKTPASSLLPKTVAAGIAYWLLGPTTVEASCRGVDSIRKDMLDWAVATLVRLDDTEYVSVLSRVDKELGGFQMAQEDWKSLIERAVKEKEKRARRFSIKDMLRRLLRFGRK